MTMSYDMQAVASGINKLPPEEALEVKLCLLQLLAPFALKNQAFAQFLTQLREALGLSSHS